MSALQYDKTIRTETRTTRLTTVHTNAIDWDGYDFADPKNFPGITPENKPEELKRSMDYLRLCASFASQRVWASDYGGWPGIWDRVIGVGMVSAWPYWEPRPMVCVDGTLGAEWKDWRSLTHAEIRP